MMQLPNNSCRRHVIDPVVPHSPLLFRASDMNAIGLEIEMQLLDSNSLDLSEGIMRLMDFYPGDGCIKPEFIQNTVEICTPVCHTIEDLDRELRGRVLDLQKHCHQLGMTLCAAGSHPFNRSLASITPMPRYLEQAAREGFTSHTQITFATHVHLGMRSGEEAIHLMHAIKRYLPLLIAVSANSPFWRGYDTNYAAYRHHVLAATRSYGIPPSFSSWKEFARFLCVTRKAGIFRSVNDIHWDIRPRPQLGSLEIRVMDAQPCVSDAVALAAFIQAIVAWLRENSHHGRDNRSEPIAEWVARDNHYQAAHYGLQAIYYDHEKDTKSPMLEHFEESTLMIDDIMHSMKLEKYFDHLKKNVAASGGAAFQREVYRKTGSFYAVMAALVDRLNKDIGWQV